jgi:hypothetical protein
MKNIRLIPLAPLLRPLSLFSLFFLNVYEEYTTEPVSLTVSFPSLICVTRPLTPPSPFPRLSSLCDRQVEALNEDLLGRVMSVMEETETCVDE